LIFNWLQNSLIKWHSLLRKASSGRVFSAEMILLLWLHCFFFENGCNYAILPALTLGTGRYWAGVNGQDRILIPHIFFNLAFAQAMLGKPSGPQKTCDVSKSLHCKCFVKKVY